MVKALFDSNILIDLLRNHDEARAEIALFDDRAISIITWMEVMVGASETSKSNTRAFLAGFDRIELNEAVAERAVDLRRKHHMKLPDAIVWASAQTQGRLLVTRNTKDFPTDDPGVRIPYVVS